MSVVEYSEKHNPLMQFKADNQEMFAALPSESISSLIANKNVFIVNPITIQNTRALENRASIAQEGRLVLMGIDPKTREFSSLKIHHAHLSKRKNKVVDGLVVTYLQNMPSLAQIKVRDDCDVVRYGEKPIKLLPMSQDEYNEVFGKFRDFVLRIGTVPNKAN